MRRCAEDKHMWVKVTDIRTGKPTGEIQCVKCGVLMRPSVVSEMDLAPVVTVPKE